LPTERPGGTDESDIAAVLRALAFAADRHRDQRRKGAGAPPFINHAIEVAELLARVGGVDDPVTLQAAVLHDTLEDTDTSYDEIAAAFGDEVARTVLEVTDEKGLTRAERKRRQIETAPSLSERARLIRLADKIVNVQSVGRTPPLDWDRSRRRDYLEWTGEVIARCRGCNEAMEILYDAELRAALERVGQSP